MATAEVEILAPIDRSQAIRVLREIDGLIEWVRDATDKAERAGIRMGRLLAQLHSGQYWMERGCSSEEEYIKKYFPQSRAQYFRMRRTGHELMSYPVEKLEELGSSKCEDLCRVRRHSGGLIPENWFLHAGADDKDTFRRRVRAYVTGHELARPEVEDQFRTFRFFGDDIQILNRALHIASLETGSDKSDSYNLIMILKDYLSGHNERGARLQDQDGMLLLLIASCTESLSFKGDCADRLIGTVASAVERAKERT
jgi:hypothetical protein